MWVKTTTPFFGKKEERLLRTGDVIQVSEDRGAKMIARGLAAETSEPAKPKKRRKTKKPTEDKAQRPTEDKEE